MTGSTPVATTTVEAVAEFFATTCGIDLQDQGEGRRRAAEFCDRFGGLAEAKLLYAYVCRQKRRNEQDMSGLLVHILSEQGHTKRVLAHMQAKTAKVGRHGAAPAMDLPDGSRESMAKVAGYDDVDEWEVNRIQRFMWARWQFERHHLDYDERLQDIADEFGYSLEDTYDILSAACLRQYQDIIERLEQRVEAIRKDMGLAQRAVTKATLKRVQLDLDELRKEASEVHGLQDYHTKQLERAKTAKKRAWQRKERVADA